MAHAHVKLEKIVVNTGIGRLSSQSNFSEHLLPEIIKEFAALTGQHPSTRPARKSISGFKVREGQIVGLKATLRGKRMTHFLEKLNKVVFPRIRDFRGIPLTSVDANGNLTIGIKEQLVFPEINPDQSKTSFGVEITVVPKHIKTKEAAIELYRALGVPLKRSTHHG